MLDISKRAFECATCDIYFCKDCKSEHKEHAVQKVKGRVAIDTKIEKDEIEDDGLGFSDIIAGGQIATRFKYKNV